MPCSKCGTDGHNIRTCIWKKHKTNVKTTRVYYESRQRLKKEINDCCICYEQLETGNGTVTTPCGHNYCATCFANWMRKSGSCAYCRDEVCEAPPAKNQLISDEAREHFTEGLLECSELITEIRQDIRKQVVHGICDRYGRNADGVDDMVDTIEDIIETTFNPYYIMTIIGYDTMAIISEHYGE